MPAQPLLPGEDPATTSPAEAQNWCTVYQDLVAVGEAQLARVVSGDIAPGERGALTETSIRERSEHLRAQVDFWRDRAWQLRGLHVDDARLELIYRGNSVRFSSRDLQLARAFLTRPNRVLSSTDLLRDAWNGAVVSPGALRAYLGRVRRKLDELDLADIATHPGSGYLLTYRCKST